MTATSCGTSGSSVGSNSRIDKETHEATPMAAPAKTNDWLAQISSRARQAAMSSRSDKERNTCSNTNGSTREAQEATPTAAPAPANDWFVQSCSRARQAAMSSRSDQERST